MLSGTTTATSAGPVVSLWNASQSALATPGSPDGSHDPLPASFCTLVPRTGSRRPTERSTSTSRQPCRLDLGIRLPEPRRRLRVTGDDNGSQSWRHDLPQGRSRHRHDAAATPGHRGKVARGFPDPRDRRRPALASDQFDVLPGWPDGSAADTVTDSEPAQTPGTGGFISRSRQSAAARLWRADVDGQRRDRHGDVLLYLAATGHTRTR